MSEGCIFCRIAKGEIPADKIFEDEHFVAFKDIKPIAPAHILIVPKEHIPTLNDLGSDKATMAGDLLATAREVAKKAGVAESGYRTVINCNSDAGQEVFHLHVHVIGGKRLGGMG